MVRDLSSLARDGAVYALESSGLINRRGPDLSVELGLQLTLPLPEQDGDLPDRIEAAVHQVGLELQRPLFRALIEKDGREPVLSRRRGEAGASIRRRVTRPFTFKTTSGEVTVERCRGVARAAG